MYLAQCAHIGAKYVQNLSDMLVKERSEVNNLLLRSPPRNQTFARINLPADPIGSGPFGVARDTG